MYRVFTRDEAMAAGISPAQLRSPRYRSISRGLYCPTSVLPSQAEVVAALMRKLPVAQFACRETAAGLHGAVVPHSSEVHLGTAQRRTSTRPDVALHWYRSPPELTRVRGLTVTSPRQTFLDLAATLPFVDLLVLGDSLVHAEACTVDMFTGLDPGRRPGAARAREVAALVRKGVESPYETRARLLIISCGLPEPEPNHPLRDATGRIVRRIDLGYEHYGIAVEYDGRDHIRREEQWHSDIARREELDDDWKFIVLTSRDIHRKQAQTAERVHKALRARGYKGPFDPLGWRRHFAP